MDPIMRRAMGWRVGLLLLLLFPGLVADARKGEAVVTNAARVVGLLNVAGDWNAEA